MDRDSLTRNGHIAPDLLAGRVATPTALLAADAGLEAVDLADPARAGSAAVQDRLEAIRGVLARLAPRIGSERMPTPISAPCPFSAMAP